MDMHWLGALRIAFPGTALMLTPAVHADQELDEMVTSRILPRFDEEARASMENSGARPLSNSAFIASLRYRFTSRWKVASTNSQIVNSGTVARDRCSYSPESGQVARWRGTKSVPFIRIELSER